MKLSLDNREILSSAFAATSVCGAVVSLIFVASGMMLHALMAVGISLLLAAIANILL